MRSQMPYYSVSGTVRKSAASPFSENLLCDALERWPAGELEVRQPESYFLLPGPREAAIPLGGSFREAEPSLRKLING
jgi:hypothetical protein